MSPSSRRAWVEIAGGVEDKTLTQGSPSSRRAWVEIAYMRNRQHRRGSRPPRGGRG